VSGGLRVAIVGATGLVGETLIKILEERRFPAASLRAFATARSAGTPLEILGRRVPVEQLADVRQPFQEIDLVFFAAGEEVSLAYAPAAAKEALVIDKSSAFRLDPAVPLVVPEVNADLVRRTGLVANPNCSTIPIAVALSPVDREFGLEWVSVTTYQSVSGAGKDALQELEDQSSGGSVVRALPRRIARNVIPQIGSFGPDGACGEERKIASELRKILKRPGLRVSATTVRVPVEVGHSAAVAFGTARTAAEEELAEVFCAAGGVKFARGDSYVTPIEAAGSDDVFVGRLRADAAHPAAHLCWIVCDNLRKGAATNAVQIAEIALGAGAPAHAR